MTSKKPLLLMVSAVVICGLVEEASILESELSKEISDSFTECLRESIYALRLDAPEWGGRHTVRYPLFFRAIGHDD